MKSFNHKNHVQDKGSMSEWKEYKLRELTTKIGSGATPIGGSNAYKMDGITLIRSQNVLDYKFSYEGLAFIDDEQASGLKNVIVNEKDVLLNITGDSVARVCKVPKEVLPARVNQHVAIIRVDESKTNADYILYYLQSIKEFLLVYSEIGGTRNALTKAMIENLEILLPPLPEQTAIAEVLSSLDDKIDLLHRQNKTLEQLAETLFSEKLKVNNEKWAEKPLSSLIETTLGGEWGKEAAEGEFTKQVCCIRGTDIADLQVGLAERTPIRFVKNKKFESIQPKDGDLVLEISGGTDDQSTGRTIYINEQNRYLFPYPLIFSNFCRLIRPTKKEYSYFLYLYIQYLYKKDEFFNLENGSSGIKNLDYKYLLNDLNFLLPTNEKEITEFDSEVRIYFEKINKNKHQIRTLTQLRDTLLPKLMSGEVRVN